MSLRDRLIAEIEEWLWGEQAPPAPEPTSEHAIVHDTFDEMTWAMLNQHSSHIAKANKDFELDFEVGGAEALEDAFNLLYQSDPRMTGRAEMLPSFLGNHHVLSEFYDTDEVAALRRHTLLDDFQSGFALLSMRQALYDALARMEEARKRQQQAQEQLAAAAQALAEARQAGGTDEELGAALACAQGAKGAADQAQADVDAIGQQVGQDLAYAAQTATEEIEEIDVIMSTHGRGPGELKRLDFDRRYTLSQRLRRSEKMQKLAKLLGGFRSQGKAERRRRVKHQPAEVYDYVLGNDLTKVVPEEFNNLAIPELEDLFWQRWAQHGLLTRKVRGPERAGQGPIIIVCDESQSMESKVDEEGNTREMWSKAVALAMVEQARKEKRDFTYIGFSTEVEYEATFKKGDAPLERVVDFVEHFACGGTSFPPALERALTLIHETEKRNESRPDVLFVTDGDGHVDEEFLERWHAALKRTDATCYAVQIGDSSHSRLKEITDKVININKLNANPEGVAELFRNI